MSQFAGSRANGPTRPSEASKTLPLPKGLLLGREAAPRPTRTMGFVAEALAPPAAGPAPWVPYPGDGHLLTFASSGEGKTTGPLISNALTWPGTLIALDIKGEVHDATAAARRAMGQSVYTIDMRSGHPSDSLNPIDMAALGGADLAVNARSLAASIVTRTGQERDMFWLEHAESLITAGILWASQSEKPEETSLGAFFDILTSDDAVYTLATMLDTKQFKHRAAVAAVKAFLSMPDRETRPSALASTIAPLRLFDSDTVGRLTDTTSLPLGELVAGEPMSLYIIVSSSQLAAYRPLLSLWLSGLMNALSHRTRMPNHKTLMLVDEAGNLGRIPSLLTAYTLLRGYGMQIWTFWQNVAQLDIYEGQARTILDNAGVVQLFGARNRRMAEEFAAMMGGISADTIMAMPRDEQLVLLEGRELIQCRRLRYFAEPELAGLSEVYAPGMRR